MHLYGLFLLPFLLFLSPTIHSFKHSNQPIHSTTSNSTTQSPPPPLTKAQVQTIYERFLSSDPSESNRTIYELSKSLCPGCWAEPIEFLWAHNLVRARHWELPFLWDPQLEAHATWWAQQRKGDCRLEHSFPPEGFVLGENIFWGGGGGWRPSDAVSTWAGEEKDYDYGANACAPGKMCGHYTQIVWRSTWRVGCARVVCDDGDVFISCNYDPPGNVVGERPY